MKIYPKVWAICFLLILGWSALLGLRYHANLIQLQHSNRSVAAMVKAGRHFEPISFPAEEVLWIKPHEIGYEGQKFDLREWYVSGDTLHAMAYRDTKENEIENKLKQAEGDDEETLTAHFQFLFYICPEFLELPESVSGEKLKSLYKHHHELHTGIPEWWNPPRT